MGEIEAQSEDEIIVYCKAGSRSQNASEILGNNEFNKIYNLIGGIESWTEIGLMIWSLSHNVKINSGSIPKIQIKPRIPNISNCFSCNNGSTNGDSCGLNITQEILEEDDQHKLVRMLYSHDNITDEVITEVTYLLRYMENNEQQKRSLSFNRIESTYNDESLPQYSLVYNVECSTYNFSIYTILIPLDSDHFNISSTTIYFIPLDKRAVTSDIVEFDETILKLSELYKYLSKTAKKLGKKYEKYFQNSEDENIENMGENYYKIKDETKYLSTLVKKHLKDSDLYIIKSIAVISDVCIPEGVLICGLINLWGCNWGSLFICTLAGLAGFFWGAFCGLYFAFVCEFWVDFQTCVDIACSYPYPLP